MLVDDEIQGNKDVHTVESGSDSVGKAQAVRSLARPVGTDSSTNAGLLPLHLVNFCWGEMPNNVNLRVCRIFSLH